MGLGRWPTAILSTQSAKGSHLEESSRTAAEPGAKFARSKPFQPGIWPCIFFSFSKSIDRYAAS